MGRVGGRNMVATKVYEAATRYMDGKVLLDTPPWYNAMGRVPPSEILTRTQPPQHRARKVNTRARKPSKLFQPLTLEYEEDQLRKDFYRDHPWELARPRIVLENDGKDGLKTDWSRIQQRSQPLNGESVIQRQMWLMNEGGLAKSQAYDIARKEFYALRHEEEVERRVAKEEALWVGATFGKGTLEIGMELEDKTYEEWKVWAEEQVQAIEIMRDSAYTGIGTKNAEDSSLDADPAVEPLAADEQTATA